MIDGTYLVRAGTASYRKAQAQVAQLIERLPTLIIGRAKESDAGRVYGICQVRRTGIVANEKVQCAEQSRQSSQRRLPH